MYCTESKVFEVPSSSQKPPELAKDGLGVVSDRFQRQRKEHSETGTAKESFFALSAIWEIQGSLPEDEFRGRSQGKGVSLGIRKGSHPEVRIIHWFTEGGGGYPDCHPEGFPSGR